MQNANAVTINRSNRNRKHDSNMADIRFLKHSCGLIYLSVINRFFMKLFKTRNIFCGTWYLPHSHVHNERSVPIIMAGCIAHAQNGHISTSGLKSDVTNVFLDPDFF